MKYLYTFIFAYFDVKKERKKNQKFILNVYVLKEICEIDRCVHIMPLFSLSNKE